MATGIEQAEEELRVIRKQANDAQSQKSGFEVQLAQKRMESQNLKDRVWQKYQVNVDTMEHLAADHLELNEIGDVKLDLPQMMKRKDAIVRQLTGGVGHPDPIAGD